MDITEEYLKNLNPTCHKHPENFGDYKVKKTNVLNLAESLFNLGCTEKVVRFEQDSNHYALIYTGYGSLRFSLFDDLVVITDEENFPRSLLGNVIETIKEHGYTYVPWKFFGEPLSTRKRNNGDLFNQLFDWC